MSRTAVRTCRARFGADPAKAFRLASEYHGETAELVLSLDVIFHLVEDEVFERYMGSLFDAAERFVIIYASNFDEVTASHVRHRSFTRWVELHAPRWRLLERVPNRHPYAGDDVTGSLADFYVYARS